MISRIEDELELEAESSQDWLEYELSEVSLGDKRLNWRILDTAKKLAAKPGSPINQACDDWADTKASYRLLDNQKTTVEKIRHGSFRNHFIFTNFQMAPACFSERTG